MTTILVIDIETTGFSSTKNKIVEIGIAELDLITGKIEIVFDEFIKEDGLTVNEFTESWIFKNSDIKIDDISNAKNIQHYFGTIQEIISSNRIGTTAFNNSFDFRFLEARGFVILRKLSDPMKLSRNICRMQGKNNGYKFPTVEEAYNYFYPGENYIETHRAADDAKHEAKIIHSLYKLGIF